MTCKLALSSLVVTLLLGVAGCSDKSAAPQGPQNQDAQPAATASAKHAPAGAKPGSHEDWCGEHAVPESQCTQCHPELIDAFKATGDWCEEHGLPESHCKKCNPDLVIQRPPKSAKE